ncbi:HupK protein, partial [Rhodovulum sulfidophilum]|nr:HupK protein [Rhodovulum sulfidophilum]
VREGRVSSFRRWTPTDHLLARGGVLERALASLPRARVELAPLVVDILDPCLPVHFEEAADA